MIQIHYEDEDDYEIVFLPLFCLSFVKITLSLDEVIIIRLLKQWKRGKITHKWIYIVSASTYFQVQ